MFMIGVGIFTAASAAAALAPSADWLIAARAVQGFGAAIVTPLTLTILSAAVPRDQARRSHSAPGRASPASPSPCGPLVGGAVVDGISWQWIFWLNVPIGLVLLPLATRLSESHRARTRHSTSPGSRSRARGCSGSSGASSTATETAGRARRSSARSRSAPRSLVAFVAWELRTTAADAADAVLPQPGVRGGERRVAPHVLRDVRLDLPADASSSRPRRATRRSSRACASCPGRSMPMFVAPIAGALSDRIGGQAAHGSRASALQAIGLAWIASVSTRDGRLRSLVGPFILSGIGMALFFAPVANVVLSRFARRRKARPRAPTTRSARSAESSASPCSHRSSRATAATSRPQTFNDGLVPALWVGAIVVGVGPARSLLIPRKRRCGRDPCLRARRASSSPNLKRRRQRGRREGGDVMKLSTAALARPARDIRGARSARGSPSQSLRVRRDRRAARRQPDDRGRADEQPRVRRALDAIGRAFPPDPAACRQRHRGRPLRAVHGRLAPVRAFVRRSSSRRVRPR